MNWPKYNYNRLATNLLSPERAPILKMIMARLFSDEMIVLTDTIFISTRLKEVEDLSIMFSTEVDHSMVKDVHFESGGYKLSITHKTYLTRLHEIMIDEFRKAGVDAALTEDGRPFVKIMPSRSENPLAMFLDKTLKEYKALGKESGGAVEWVAMVPFWLEREEEFHSKMDPIERAIIERAIDLIKELDNELSPMCRTHIKITDKNETELFHSVIGQYKTSVKEHTLVSAGLSERKLAAFKDTYVKAKTILTEQLNREMVRISMRYMISVNFKAEGMRDVTLPLEMESLFKDITNSLS